MSKTPNLASAFGSITKSLGAKTAKSGGKEVAVAGTRQRRNVAKTAKVAGDKAERAARREVRRGNRQMRTFARNLKNQGVRRLRFMPYADIVSGGATFRLGGKLEDRIAELTNFYTAKGTLKSVRANAEKGATVIRLNYSKSSRVEVYDEKGAVFFA